MYLKEAHFRSRFVHIVKGTLLWPRMSVPPRGSYFLSHVHHFTRHSKTLYPIKLTSGTKYLGPPGIIRHIFITIVYDRYNRYARYIY